MSEPVCLALILLLVVGLSACHAESPKPWDRFADTWVATDALGRKLSTHEQVGPPRAGKFVGIFYFLWMGQHGTDGPYDVTKILAEHPDAMKTPTSPPWGPMYKMHHWGEPLFGYYLSDDAWVIRKHAQMLADAGVDVVIFDVTNQATYQKVYMKLCEVFADVRRNGGDTPQIAFLTPFWDPPKVVKELYDNLYKPGLYSDLWFRWKGKPLILADPEKVPPETKDFFTFRKPEPSYFVGPSGPNQWGWLEAYPQHIFYDDAGKPEQMVVGIGQNAHDGRLSAFSVANTYGRSWHNGKKDERPGAVNFGFNVMEQWKRALEVDPEFIFITGWNEWVAQRFLADGVYNLMTGRKLAKGDSFFVDAYNQEYSRDIEPMKGGHTDNYYYQMIDGIRRFKGVRAPERSSGPSQIKIDGRFDDWKSVRPELRDWVGDTEHRNSKGWGDAGTYVNTTGRNDFVRLKVAYDPSFVYFYAETRGAITSRMLPNWMLLFIDADCDSSTGWHGYDYLVNYKVSGPTTTTLMRTTQGWNWKQFSTISYQVAGNKMEIRIPRRELGLAGKKVALDFHWADNIRKPDDIMQFAVSGDSAPDRRFNYHFEQR